MATLEWIGNAVDVADICTLTVTGTWVTSETATIAVNGKSLVVTLGTPVTVTDVAALIVRAWNSETRINDSLGSSNVGGQSIPEFAEIIASNSAGVITLATRNASDTGKPFQSSITRSDSSASGTLGAVTSVQAATGKSWWSNVKNWSTGAVPVNGDTVVFRDNAVPCKYGLPQGSLEVAVVIHNSYTGQIGLPKVNRDNSAKSYYEYRDRYVELDDAGAGVTATHVIGMGLGKGPSLVNLQQTALPTTYEIDCNGTPLSSDQKAVNVVAGTTGTLLVRKGSVDGSTQNGQTSDWDAITLAGKKNQLSDIDVLIDGNASTSTLVNQLGGKLAITQTTWSTNGVTLVGGELTLDAPCPSIEASEGTIVAIGNGTIADIDLGTGGHLDASRGAGSLTITNATLAAGSKVSDPASRLVHTNPFSLIGTTIKGVDLDYGYNRTLQVA